MDVGCPVCDQIAHRTGSTCQSVCTNSQVDRIESSHNVCQLCATVHSLWIRESRLSTSTRVIDRFDWMIKSIRAHAKCTDDEYKVECIATSIDGCDHNPSHTASHMTLSHTTMSVLHFGVWIGRESLQSSVSIDCTSNQRLSRIAPQCDTHDHMRRRGWSESLINQSIERRAISQFVESREPCMCLSLSGSLSLSFYV
jgi:hypothetical protein